MKTRFQSDKNFPPLGNEVALLKNLLDNLFAEEK